MTTTTKNATRTTTYSTSKNTISTFTQNATRTTTNSAKNVMFTTTSN